MKKHYHKRFDETYYTHTLDNGLKVVLWEKKNFDKAYFMLATPIGGLDLHQIDENGKEYAFPAGIAHFLEHKMFESAQGEDVMELFSQMGANVNAFTSYTETAYYFSTSEDCIQPLHLLLDFVQTLSITDESVEKEKGIIIQELEMYQQMSEVRLINESLSAVYKEHPLRYDIGGDIESVNAITKEQLEQCYALNYHPSKTMLIGVTSLDVELVLKEIEANQAKKQFSVCPVVHRKPVIEQESVATCKKTIQMDVGMPKVCVSYKLKVMDDPAFRNLNEWCFKTVFDFYFSTLNEAYQTWLDEEIINTSFNFEIDFNEDYSVVMFYSETRHKQKFIDLIHTVLNDIQPLNEEILTQLKNRYFGLCVNALNSHNQIASTFMRNYFVGNEYFDAVNAIEDLTLADIKIAFTYLDINNKSIVEVTNSTN